VRAEVEHGLVLADKIQPSAYVRKTSTLFLFSVCGIKLYPFFETNHLNVGTKQLISAEGVR